MKKIIFVALTAAMMAARGAVAARLCREVTGNGERNTGHRTERIVVVYRCSRRKDF